MFRIRQWIKMLLQNAVLPAVYWVYRKRPVQPGRILMADAHHETIPFSMRRMYETLKEQGHEPELFIADFSKLSFHGMALFLIRFMKAYAQAECVFICDYFLPASSCRKREETKLIQLWHSCGLMKKIAFDAGEDIPKNYHGNMFGNYTYLTMSAPVCVPVHAKALRLDVSHIAATGISRTDYYFDETWKKNCRERFLQACPQAAGKKVAVWAPTFRGNAAAPYLEGLEAVRSAAKLLGEEWYLIIKAHPHIDAHRKVSNCDLPTEELFDSADLLITDYSSVLFDYLIYRKPLILFAPDLKEYEQKRGFYVDYRSMPFPVIEDGDELPAAISNSLETWEKNQEKIEEFTKLYLSACDGHATNRILKLAQIERGTGKSTECAEK